MDESDPETVARIARALDGTREPGWLAPHHIKVHNLGTSIHIDMHLAFPRFWTLETAHVAADVVEAAMRETFEAATETMVHMEPCTPQLCTACDLADCPVRGEAFQRRNEWTAERLMVAVGRSPDERRAPG